MSITYAASCDFNLLETEIHGCVKYEYLNIRGHQGYNCAAFTGQATKGHMHLESPKSKLCGRLREPGTIVNEDNFRMYEGHNPQHRCSANVSATTQWWLGGS